MKQLYREIDVIGRIELSAEGTVGKDTLAAEHSPSDGAIMLDAYLCAVCLSANMHAS